MRMKKLFTSITVMLLACAAVSPVFAQASREVAGRAEPATRTIVDHDGESVEIPDVVGRVAIVQPWPLPSVMTIFLGGTEKIVGIPPAALGAAKAGLLGEMFPSYLNISTKFDEGDEINVEELLKLDPDVVFVMAGNAKQKQTVKDAGIPAIGFSVNKWNYDNIATYDGWIGLLSQVWPEYAKNDKVSAYSHGMEQMIQERVGQIPDGQRKKVLFLFQYSEKTMVTSGKRFFGQSWCDEIGAKNVAEDIAAENSSAIINMEQVYQWDPDVILITNFTPTVPEDLYNNTVSGYDWAPVKAVREGQVYKMPLGTYRSYTPSADTPVTLLWMAQKVYPEIFSDYDLVAEVDLTDAQIRRMYNQTSGGAAGTRKA